MKENGSEIASMNWWYSGTYPTYFTQSLAHYQSTGGPSQILEVNPLSPLSPLRGDISTQIYNSHHWEEIFPHTNIISPTHRYYLKPVNIVMAPVPYVHIQVYDNTLIKLVNRQGVLRICLNKLTFLKTIHIKMSKCALHLVFQRFCPELQSLGVLDLLYPDAQVFADLLADQSQHWKL